MEHFLTITKDFGPLATFLIALVFIGMHFYNVNGIRGELKEIKETLKDMLIENEKKVSYGWIEKELQRYTLKEVGEAELRRLYDSVRSQGERIGELERHKKG